MSASEEKSLVEAILELRELAEAKLKQNKFYIAIDKLDELLEAVKPLEAAEAAVAAEPVATEEPAPETTAVETPVELVAAVEPVVADEPVAVDEPVAADATVTADTPSSTEFPITSDADDDEDDADVILDLGSADAVEPVTTSETDPAVTEPETEDQDRAAAGPLGVSTTLNGGGSKL